MQTNAAAKRYTDAAAEGSFRESERLLTTHKGRSALYEADVRDPPLQVPKPGCAGAYRAVPSLMEPKVSTICGTNPSAQQASV
jgi:hypothetical protein